jgi:hypothetical protein
MLLPLMASRQPPIWKTFAVFALIIVALYLSWGPY